MSAANFPTNIVILINLGLIGSTFVTWFVLSQTLNRMSLAPQVKRVWRWGTAVVLSLWFLVRLGLAVNPTDGAVLGTSITVGFVVFGITIGTLPLFSSPVFRQIIRTTPPTWIIAIHAARIIGASFLALHDMKLLPPEFALPAGYGDVTVAALALVTVYALTTRKPYARALAIGWNLLGILDFITALSTGATFITPFARQLAASGMSLSYLNYVLIIPAFGVPLIGVLHIYSLYQLLNRRRDEVSQGLNSPAVSNEQPIRS